MDSTHCGTRGRGAISVPPSSNTIPYIPIHKSTHISTKTIIYMQFGAVKSNPKLIECFKRKPDRNDTTAISTRHNDGATKTLTPPKQKNNNRLFNLDPRESVSVNKFAVRNELDRLVYRIQIPGASANTAKSKVP